MKKKAKKAKKTVKKIKKTAKKKRAKAKKPAKPKKTAKKVLKEKIIGNVEHYFDKICVVTTTLKNPLKVGDVIHVKGHTTDFIQTVDSLQIEHEGVQKAKKGDGVGVKVKDVIRDHDVIYLADKKTIAQFNKANTPAAAPAVQKPEQKFFNF